MKRLLLATSIALLSLSSTAVLAGPDQGGGRDKHEQGGDHGGRHGGSDKHDQRGDREARHGNFDRHDQRWADGRSRHGHNDNGRHLGWQKQRFHRGQRVPVVYLQPRYYVQDYRYYNLAPPPYGYRWVRPDNGRYLLVSITTGLISQMLGY